MTCSLFQFLFCLSCFNFWAPLFKASSTREVFYDIITKYTDIFIEKMREAFALQKILTFFQQKKNWQIPDIDVGNSNETLTNDVVSFEQPGPGFLVYCFNFNSVIYSLNDIVPQLRDTQSLARDTP